MSYFERDLWDTMKIKTNRSLDDFELTFLNQALSKRMQKNETIDLEDYKEILRKNEKEIDDLNQALTITTSQFFRDELTFNLLNNAILEIISSKKGDKSEIRVWCVGCAAGQEPYSISIAIHDLEEKLGIEIPFRIFATDISESALLSAQTGVYDESSLQNIRLRHLSKYFTLKEGNYQLAKKIMKHVYFSKQDILDENSFIPTESIYGNFDIIFCCNLLIYYKPTKQHEIVEKLIHALSYSGFLILGETERGLIDHHSHLKQLAPTSCIYQTNRRDKK